mmetsp:Transcript_53885/g.129831  ORF Transcript_53885/g.129831 Transcript_53885/m.129831 type:complete len:261 (-) Transcript_53885:861-1643(-)
MSVLRECVCSAPVMKPCGKKKPLSQYDIGGPWFTHLPIMARRAYRSSTHGVNGLSDGYAAFSHRSGTIWKRKHWCIASSSADMTTRPLMAFFSMASDDLITLTSLLKRTISCSQNTPIEFTLPLLVFAKVSGEALRLSKGSGSFSRMSSAISPTISSGVLPPALPEARGCMLMIVRIRSPVSFRFNVISAFSCRPKVSGASSSGSCSMYDSTPPSSPSAGAWYSPLSLNLYESLNRSSQKNLIRMARLVRLSHASVARPP